MSRKKARNDPNIYRFRKTIKPSEESQQVGELLADMRKRDGSLHPCAVVEEATPEDSPIHKYFEWDDTAAAQEHRNAQARRLIMAVEIVREDSQEEVVMSIPAFTHLRADKSGYRDTDEVYATPELRSSLSVQLQEDWKILKRKHDEILQEMEAYELFNREVETI